MSGAENDHRSRFEQLYTDTRVAILGYLMRRIEEPADAADLLAEVYLVAWRRVTDIPEGDAARLWLYGVARRTLANHRRHRQVADRLAQVLRSQLADALTNHQVRDPGLVDAVDACLEKLSDLDREIVKLAVYEQLSPAEIAEVVGKRVGTIRVRLHRARRFLRAALLDAGYAGRHSSEKMERVFTDADRRRFGHTVGRPLAQADDAR